MNVQDGKYAWMVKIGEKGQFVIPKEAREIFELYYYSDLSLREIAENRNISYQAVNDCVRKVKKQLLEYEENIKAMEMKQDILTLIQNNNKEIDKIARKYR